MKNMTIATLGVGGVGGYIGGKLAGARQPGVRTVFIARGQTLDVIRQNGLKLITEDEGPAIVHPDLVSNDPAAIGPIDLLICSVKGYDLEEGLKPYAPCITPQTIVLPFLNGIGIADKVRAVFPAVEVWEGVIYIAARQLEKGVVQQTGAPKEILFGGQGGDPRAALDVFTRAGLDARIPADIDLEVWRKFLFISVMATATSFYNSAIGVIRDDAAKYAHVKALLDECYAVALANGIRVTEDVKASVAQRIDKTAPAATTSMYADFQKGGHTEVEALTGDVVRLGRQLGVPTPVYADMYRALSAR